MQSLPQAYTLLCECQPQVLIGVDIEVRRQIQLFLSAGIQPDIILLENQGTSGMLYRITLPNGQTRSRGVANAAVSQQQLQMEICGQLPTGNIAS